MCRELLGVILQPYSYVAWSVAVNTVLTAFPFLWKCLSSYFGDIFPTYDEDEDSVWVMLCSLLNMETDISEGKGAGASSANVDVEMMDNPIVSSSNSQPPSDIQKESQSVETTTATTTSTKTDPPSSSIFKETRLYFIRTMKFILSGDIIYTLQTIYSYMNIILILASLDYNHSSYSSWNLYQQYALKLVMSSIPTTLAGGASVFVMYNLERSKGYPAKPVLFLLPWVLPIACTHILPGIILYIWVLVISVVGFLVGAVGLTLVFYLFFFLMYCCAYLAVCQCIGENRDSLFSRDSEHSGGSFVLGPGTAAATIIARVLIVMLLQCGVTYMILFYTRDYSYLDVIEQEFYIRHESCFYDSSLSADQFVSFFSFL